MEGGDNVHLSKIIVNTRVPLEDQIQENAEGSQEGTQGQRQDPKARCSSFLFLQTLLLGGSVSRTGPKGQDGWDSCAVHLHLMSPPPVPASEAVLWRPPRLLRAFPRHGPHVARAGVSAGSWWLVLWASHFPSPTAARAGAQRSPAGGADPVDTPPRESLMPRGRKRQSRRCPERSRAPLPPRASDIAHCGCGHRVPCSELAGDASCSRDGMAASGG